MPERIVIALLTCVAVAGVAVCVVAVLSLRPTVKAEMALPRLATTSIRAGHFAFLADPWSRPTGRSGTAVLLIRDTAGQLQAFWIPTLNGKPAVPVSHPWVEGLPCAAFEPSFATQDIACREQRDPAAWVMRHRWSMQGKNLSGTAADLVPVEGSEQHGEFVFFKPPSHP